MKVFLHRGDFPKQEQEIAIGGSKSESNRLLILQAQFPNISIDNISESEDTRVLHLGLSKAKGTVDIHHAGTAMRFLTAYFASLEGDEITLTGSLRMKQRPIGILVDALRKLGAEIEYGDKQDFPPLKIKGKSLRKAGIAVDSGVSSQFISALMLIGPRCEGGLELQLNDDPVSLPYIQMTLALLNQIGITATFVENKITIPSVEAVPDVNITVESDWSSASYFYSLVALSENLSVKLRHFYKYSIQGDSILPIHFKKLGVQTIFDEEDRSITLSKKKSSLPKNISLDLSDNPDLAQTLAVTCFGLGIGCKLTGLQTLKIKETDRLQALKNELTKLGAEIQVDEDSLQLESSKYILTGKTINTYQDHRMAMAFAPLAIKTEIVIDEPAVVSKSYPNFWKDLEKVGIRCDFRQ